MKKQISAFVIVMSLVALAPLSAHADSCSADGKDDYSAELRAKGDDLKQKAREILNNMQADAETPIKKFDGAGQVLNPIRSADAKIPAELLAKAQCVVIMPEEKTIDVTLLGPYAVRYGTGVSMCRDEKGVLGNPSFVHLRGGSWGAQFGVKFTDQVLLFMNPEAQKSLSKKSLDLGAGAGLAAGPIGRDFEADTNAHFQNEILSYSHSRGLYAGATLDSGMLEPDKKMNQAAAGEPVKRGFFNRIGHAIASFFRHDKKSDCSAQIAVARAIPEASAVVAEATAPISIQKEQIAAANVKINSDPKNILPVEQAAPAETAVPAEKAAAGK